MSASGPEHEVDEVGAQRTSSTPRRDGREADGRQPSPRMIDVAEERLADQVAPTSPGRLTPDWLTHALRSGGVIHDASVVSIDVRPIGSGMAGRVVQVGLEYAGDVVDAPTSVVVKLPAAPGSTLDMALRLGIYEREARFYSEVAPTYPAPAPRLYHSCALAPGRHVLVLEDLSPACEGNLLYGCGVEQVEVVVGWIAVAHAACWGSPALDALDWLPAPNYDAASTLATESTDKAWKIFRGKMGRNAPRHVVALGERLGDSPNVLDQLSAAPRTLVHGDLRLPNVMFAPGGAPVAIVDWQTVMQGRGPMDLAALFLFSLSPADRRKAEAKLLPRYCQHLEGHGVEGYSLEQCWRDYRLSLIDQFSQIVLLSSLLDVDSTLDHDVANAVGARLFAAIEDLNLIELLAPPRRWWPALFRR